MAEDPITGLVLAGGRGSRMGGVDKGLQKHAGVPLALHALMRLGPQVEQVMINANRNLSAYEAFGAPVWPDGMADHPGPLAGFLTGLEQCETPFLVTAPCDSPLFPLDLVPRIVTSEDWAGLTAGLAQRVRALEAFLRDVYGVKVVASDAFTRGLVDRGIISLGFG